MSTGGAAATSTSRSIVPRSVGKVDHLAEIAQQRLLSSVLRLLDEQFAVTLDRVQRCSEVVAKVGKLSFLGKVGDLCNQLGKLPCGVAHPL